MHSGASLSVIAVGLVAGLLASGTAGAANTSLHGTFGGVGTLSCLNAPGGFNASLEPNDPAQASIFASNLVWLDTFNKNGTGTNQSTGVSVSIGGAGSSTSSASFTYAIAKTGVITITAKNVSGKAQTGSRAGQTFTIDQVTDDAYLADGGKIVVVATATPAIETITWSNGDSYPRICTREAALAPVSP